MPHLNDPLEELIAELDRVARSERTEAGPTITVEFLRDLRSATDALMWNRTPEEIGRAMRSNPASLRVQRYLQGLYAKSSPSQHSKQSGTTRAGGDDLRRPHPRRSSKPRAKSADEPASPTGRARLTDP